jgi:hypothetical protein
MTKYNRVIENLSSGGVVHLFRGERTSTKLSTVAPPTLKYFINTVQLYILYSKHELRKNNQIS